MTTVELTPGTRVVARYDERSLPVEGTYLGTVPAGHTIAFDAIDPVTGRPTKYVYAFKHIDRTVAA